MLENQLQKYFGFNSFKKGQKEVIDKIMKGESAAAIFPTGAGKSLCYQLPAMLLPGMTLVVSPLLSLMKDQLDFLLEHNISAARLDSTLRREEYNKILGKAKSGKLKILMISVERFKKERFRYHLQKMNVSLLVIDEAHCISEWGHNFRPEYLKLPVYRKEFGIKQILLLTATATHRVVDDMCRKLAVPSENVIITGFYRENLFLQITPANESEKNEKLIQRIKESPEAPAIVYVTLRKTAEDVAELLCLNEIKAHPYHAGMKSEERELIQNRFMNGELDCVVATIAFGMGIDKENIRRVIHYELPKSIENYSQEIGRSGRDGEKSFCEILANRDNINILENFIYGDTPEKDSIYKLLYNIKQEVGFIWEVKLTALSNELNIRMLPLKTLLVYLDIEGIITPEFTYFEEYSFKYNCQEPANIVNNFQGERKQFVTAITKQCSTKKTWTYVDIQRILNSYNTDRRRIITALEYFEEKRWIDELQTKQAIEVYDIKTKDFDAEWIAEKMYNLFKSKEEHEICRINDMIRFFENDSCLSIELAKYFGEDIKKEHCGHCSFCKEGKVTIQSSIELKSLSDFDFEEITNEFIGAVREHFSILNLTKFLCGIYTPVFSKLKIKKLPYFGIFERYPFGDVRNSVERIGVGCKRPEIKKGKNCLI
jgi:ATP-dependent DNA helicase RecQ